jgi:hypothetical protein
MQGLSSPTIEDRRSAAAKQAFLLLVSTLRKFFGIFDRFAKKEGTNNGGERAACDSSNPKKAALVAWLR